MYLEAVEMSRPVLRSYQQDAVIEILGAWADDVQRPAVVLPTGAGKTVIFATLCAMLARRGDRPLVLVNRDELVRQTIRKLHDADPDLVVGQIQGSKDDHRGHVVVASVQTLSRLRRLHRVDMDRFNRIICDEAHYAAADSWRRVLEYFGAFDKASGTRVVGFTATMERTDKRGLGEIWDDVVFHRSTRWAIQQGFLVPVRAQTVVIPELNLGAVKTRNGDLADGDLGRAMAQAKAGPLIAAAYSEMARDEQGNLRRGIVFAPTIEMAGCFLADFREAGIPTEMVIGTTPPIERQAAYLATAAGASRVLMSVGVLTTGFDLPAVEVAVIARPTKSRGLYQQMIGRALRPSPETEKTHALILDVVGASRLGLATLVDLSLDKPEIGEEIESGELDEVGNPIMIKVLPEAPEEIEFAEIDPFSGMDAGEVGVRKKILRKTAHIKAWDLTERGIPFLPVTPTFEFYICLTDRGDNTWGVWKVPKGPGAPLALGTGMTYPDAVLAALSAHPGPPAGMSGPVTDNQLKWRGVVEPSMTKQEASRAISRRLASRRLDGN